MDNLLLGMVAKYPEVYVRFCKIINIGEQVRENLLHDDLLKIVDFIYMYRLEEVVLTGRVLVQSRGLLLVIAAQLDVPVSLELSSPTPVIILSAFTMI